VLCVEELKLQLLAKSSICPGIITIIWSLITSNTLGVQDKYDDPDIELYLANDFFMNQAKIRGSHLESVFIDAKQNVS